MRFSKFSTRVALSALLLSLPVFADSFTVFNNPGNGDYIPSTTDYGGGNGSGTAISSLGPFNFGTPMLQSLSATVGATLPAGGHSMTGLVADATLTTLSVTELLFWTLPFVVLGFLLWYGAGPRGRKFKLHPYPSATRDALAPRSDQPRSEQNHCGLKRSEQHIARADRQSWDPRRGFIETHN